MISATERSGIVSHAPSTVSPAVSRALNFLTRLTPPSVARSVILVFTPPQGVGSLRHGCGHGQPAGVGGDTADQVAPAPATRPRGRPAQHGGAQSDAVTSM